MKKILETKKIVESCENSDAEGLINSVNEVLLEKIVKLVEGKQAEFGKNFFKDIQVSELVEDVQSTDSYDLLDFQMQEAVDFVVENMLNESLAYTACIQEASEKFEVEKEKLKEYVDGMVNEQQPNTDQIKSNDDDINGPNMNDMDADKRTRFESVIHSGNIVLENGDILQLSKNDENSLTTLFSELSEENKEKLASTLFEDADTFKRILLFSKKVTASSHN